MAGQDEFIRTVNEKLDELMRGKIPEAIATESSDPELTQLSRAINSLIVYFKEIHEFIVPLSQGRLSENTPATHNYMASPFKELHSRLMHLSWQTEQVARGDYNQHIDFMGDFSHSFNRMIQALKAKDKSIKEKMEQITAYTRELKEANSTKDKLFSIIAHDLKAPYNVFINVTRFLREAIEHGEKERSMHYVEMIERTADSSFVLLNNLLEWSRAQTGNWSFKPQNVKIVQIVEDVKRLFSLDMKAKKLSLTTEGENEAIVYTDYNMLSTIIRNLVSNAIKFSYEGGQISVIITATPDSSIIAIQDHGIGMNGKTLKQLNDNKSLSSTPGTQNEKGSGLGLQLCHELAERSGGRLNVKSEKGKGARFEVHLPKQPKKTTPSSAKNKAKAIQECVDSISLNGAKLKETKAETFKLLEAYDKANKSYSLKEIAKFAGSLSETAEKLELENMECLSHLLSECLDEYDYSGMLNILDAFSQIAEKLRLVSRARL